jgi:hypothetical protein
MSETEAAGVSTSNLKFGFWDNKGAGNPSELVFGLSVFIHMKFSFFKTSRFTNHIFTYKLFVQASKRKEDIIKVRRKLNFLKLRSHNC